jgi:hypothetical protein
MTVIYAVENGSGKSVLVAAVDSTERARGFLEMLNQFCKTYKIHPQCSFVAEEVEVTDEIA